MRFACVACIVGVVAVALVACDVVSEATGCRTTGVCPRNQTCVVFVTNDSDSNHDPGHCAPFAEKGELCSVGGLEEQGLQVGPACDRDLVCAETGEDASRCGIACVVDGDCPAGTACSSGSAFAQTASACFPTKRCGTERCFPDETCSNDFHNGVTCF